MQKTTEGSFFQKNIDEQFFEGSECNVMNNLNNFFI